MQESLNSNNQLNIFICAGEASGDMHAANLIKKIKAKSIHSNITFNGMGSSAMRAAGANIIVDSTDLAVIGGIEILCHFSKILRAMRTIKQEINRNRPDLLILIDYPGFNLWLAKIAKKMGIKILYYISPQIWAWHQNRVNKIRRYVDMMAVVFPFEVKFYSNAKVPVTLVRHPLLDSVKTSLDKTTAQTTFALDQHKITIGLFPGSRKNEIKYLLPIMLQAAVILKKHYPHSQFVLPLAPSLQEHDIAPYLTNLSVNITIIKNQTHNLASICDAIIATSGTVTLEIALLAIPMVIIYKLTYLTYWIIKQIIKIPYIGLCNIVAEKAIVPELIQTAASAENIAAVLIKILEDKEYRNTMIKELQQVRHKLAGEENAESIENVVLAMCLTEPGNTKT